MNPKKNKINIKTLIKKKRTGEKISAVTAYDYPTSLLAQKAGIDMILVGDSLGMVIQGKENTLSVTLEEMIYHGKMVSKAGTNSFIVIDMPFGSYQTSVTEAVSNAIKLIKESGVQAVKLEGGNSEAEKIKAIVNAGIPVVGHIGLKPQSVNLIGGFKVQGKSKAGIKKMIDEAIRVQEAGAACIVLESVPAETAQLISQKLKIPTIGIGAGNQCDGQILVFHDMMGINSNYVPSFVKQFASLEEIIIQAFNQYKEEIKSGEFPSDKESYRLNKDIEELLDESNKKD